MYRDLGVPARVEPPGRGAKVERDGRRGRRTRTWCTRTGRSSRTCPQTGKLLNEYCVAFPDDTRPYGSARLPDADDVLAKWMALTADERRVIADANMHLPGRQIDPRAGARGPRAPGRAGSVERASTSRLVSGRHPRPAGRASVAARRPSRSAPREPL